jgi:arylsulfatase A-like enzyme
VTDHGPEFNRAKMTLYDPGLGVACLLRSPGRIQPGLRLDGLRSTIDLLPTLLDLAGVTIPEFVQGESFAGALGGGDEKPREFIVGEKTWHVKLDPMRCIRTDRYKYIRNYHHNEPMQISAQHSRAVGLDRVGELYGHRRDPEELYDLLNDPDETENLADRPNYAETTDRLRSMLLRVLRETGDPLITGSWYQPRSRMPRTFWVQRGNRFSVEFNREDG